MKVIFLDIDGVLISMEDIARTRDPQLITPEKVALLNKVCEKTGARVVASTTWRRDERFRDLLKEAGFTRSFCDDWRTDLDNNPRGIQIRNWLARNDDVESFCIIDDDRDFLKSQKKFLVATDFDTGMNETHVQKMIAILNGREIVRDRGRDDR